MALNLACHTTQSYSGNGVETKFQYNFELIKEEELHVAFYDSQTDEYNDVTNWIRNGQFVEFNTAPDQDQAFVIYRVTSIDQIKANFTTGNPLKAQDLNDNFKQLQFAIEDLRCRVGGGAGEYNGSDGDNGQGWTGASYDTSNGTVTFTSDDGLGFSTSDLRGTNGTNGIDGVDGKGWTSASYDANTGVVTFVSSDGLGFPTGDLRGADGTSIVLKGSYSGIGAPSSTVAPSPVAGDLWINNNEGGDGYAYDGASWTNVGTIQGPAGNNGSGYTGSYNSGTDTLTFTGTGTNSDITITPIKGTDGLGFTNGSYDSTNGTVTFTSNDGLGFTTGDLRGADGQGVDFDSNGNVGIGLSSPNTPKEKLDVNGTILTTTIPYSGGQNQPYLIAGSTNYTGATDSWGTYGIQHRFKSNAGGTSRVTIDTSVAAYDSTGDGVNDVSSTSVERFCVTNNGNVGIGETDPTEKLDVNGTIKATQIKFGDGTVQTTASITGFDNPGDFNVRQYMTNNNVNADAAVLAAFAWAQTRITSSTTYPAPCIYFPAGVYSLSAKTLLANGSVDEPTQITIKGEGRGDSTEILLSGVLTINHPCNISGIYFKSNFNGSSLSFRRSDSVSSDSVAGAREDDMDSTISNCVFNNYGGTSSIDVDYRGRNLEVYNCRFKTGGTNGKGIKLSYYNSQDQGENVVQSELGWKRILIHGNTFHNYPTCVEIVSPDNFSSGEPRLRGFVFSTNTQETSGTFINADSSNVILEAASIVNNTCQVNQNSTALVAFKFNKLYYSTFLGNTVFGNPGQTRYARLLNTIDAKGCVINDNIVHMCDSGGGITGTMNGCRLSGNIGTAPSNSNIVNISGTNSLAANQDLTYSST